MADNDVERELELGELPAKEDKPEAAPVAPACAMVIFGAGGDLTKRLVVPALYNLMNGKRLSPNFQLVGVDLASKSAEEWRQSLTDMMNEFVTKGGGEFEADHIDQDAWSALTSRMSYLQGDLTDPDAYQRIGKHLAGLDRTRVPPEITCSTSRSPIASSVPRWSGLAPPAWCGRRRARAGAGW